jgi:hypothetical protein
MPTVSDDGAFITFTDDEVEAYNGAVPREIAPLNRMIAAYARAQGGEVLAVMECVEGPLMGQRVKWSPRRIGDHLGLAQSRVEQIRDETLAAVWPTFEASPDYPAFQAWTDAHCRKRGGEAEAR